MREHFILEQQEAASTSEAAFIFEPKSGLRAEILPFRSLRQLDDYVPTGPTIRVRSLPVLLVAVPDTTGGIVEAKVLSILRRMAAWYYYTHLNSPAAGTPPASESAD